MGFFDFLSRERTAHNKKVAAAFKCYKPDLVRTVFPDGQAQAERIISSLAKVYEVNLSVCSAKEYYDILRSYSDTWIRLHITQSTTSHILSVMPVRQKDLIKDRETARKLLTFCSICSKNPKFALNTTEDLTTFQFFYEYSLEAEQIAEANMRAAQENLENPHYGYTPEMPIYAEGINGSQRYLHGLLTANGDELSWERKGSLSLEDINGSVDIYEGTLKSGKLYATLYVNMYSTTTSNKAPVGFKLRESQI